MQNHNKESLVTQLHEVRTYMNTILKPCSIYYLLIAFDLRYKRTYAFTALLFIFLSVPDFVTQKLLLTVKHENFFTQPNSFVFPLE